MFSTKETAQKLGFKNAASVRQLISTGKLKAEKRGRDLWVGDDEIERFQKERQSRGRPRGGSPQNEPQ
jgi:hypothetical protein